MLRIIGAFLLAATLAVFAVPAHAQSPVYCYPGSGSISQSSPCQSNNPLYVTGTVSPTGTQDVNLTQVGGATVATGHGTAAGAIRVELPTDGTGVVGLTTSSSVIGKVGIDTAMTGLTPVVSGSAESSHVLKNAAGSLWSVYASNLTGTAGFLQVFNATSAPTDGAVTPLECVPLPANGVASLNFNSGPPGTYSTGITAVVSSASTCFTKTTGVITAFIRGSVQ